MSHHAEDAQSENLNAMQIVNLISNGRKKKKLKSRNSTSTTSGSCTMYTAHLQGRQSSKKGKGKNGRKKKTGNT